MPRTQPMTSLARRLAALACPLALAVGCSGDDGPATASETDGGTDTDSAAPPCVAELAPGALVITEIMANPTGPDAELEWIELHNPGDQTISLDGVRLVASKVNGDSPDEHSITGLELAPGDYVTLGNLLDPEKFVFVDYAYGDALGDLINSAGVVRVMCGDVEVDAVVYESEKDGASYTFNGALAPDATANDDSGEWCRATSLIENFQTGDLGTPGEPNGYCPPPAGQCYEGATLRPIAAPGYGDLVISEFMANPEGADAGQEWLELQVLNPVDLNELELGKTSDVEQTFFTVDDVDPTAAPGEQFQCVAAAKDATLLLAQGDDPELNGGLPAPDLLLKSSFTLNNSDSGLFIGHAGQLVDEIAYTTTTEGVATALSPEAMDADKNDDADPDPADEASAWCLATAPYGGAGAGSPGERNPKCGQCLDAQSQALRDPRPPQPGELVITEFMANPAGTDSGNEWFEVYVAVDTDLAGLEVGKQLGSLSALENPDGTCMAAKAGTYLLFGQTPGDGVDHVFDFALSNSGENALYLQARAGIVDEVHYAASQGEDEAASLGESPPDAASNDDADAPPWCPVPGGTPGAANPACP